MRRVPLRENPTGALLVNGKPKAKTINAKALLAAIGAKKNGKRRKVRRNAKHMQANGKSRKNGHKRHARYNGSHKNAYRKNALYTNGHKRRNYRRNPGFGMLLTNGNMLAPLNKMLVKIPGGKSFLVPAVNLVGASLGAGVGAAALYYGANSIKGYLPEMVQHVSHTLIGASAGALLLAVAPKSLPYRNMIAAGLPAAGVVMDVLNYLSGGSSMAGVDMAGDWGAVDDMGSPLAAHEYADSCLTDADYSGDLTDEEISYAGLGRVAFWQRFRPAYRRGDVIAHEGASHHAGAPGRRHGWLIYWIGFDNFRQLAQLEPGRRRMVIEQMRSNAKMFANKLLAGGQDTTVEAAATAGLLVTN